MNSLAQLDELLAEQKPFVAYRLPNDSAVHVLIQETSELYTTRDFTENGFVFAPYDNKKEAIIFPESKAETFALEYQPISREQYVYKSFMPIASMMMHVDLVQKAVDTIKESTLNKVVVSRVIEENIDDFTIENTFNTILDRYKNACCYCWFHPKVGLWLGATPERLFYLNNLELETISLAGTQPFNGRREVVWDAKEREEQQIVTQFIEEQLSEIASKIEVGQVETIKAGKLLHQKTTISAKMNTDNFSISQLITKLHPTPAVCGTPRKIAQDFISMNEGYDRELYTGFFGTIRDRGKSANLYVNLRCMKIENKKASIFVGGGITADSIPKKEFDETYAKASTMLLALLSKKAL